MKKGFTLVELSIVLVAIGLMIGGILIGQTLIDSSKINAQIRQIQQFDIAIEQFKTKYKSIPGDSKSLPNPGDGDGIMEDSVLNAGTYSYAWYFDYELSNFWYHLSVSGFKPDNVVYSNDASGGIKVGINIPKAAMGKGDYAQAGVIPYTQPHTDAISYYWLGDFGKTTNNFFNNGPDLAYAYTPLEVQAIDSKLDDGKNSITSTAGVVWAYTPNAGECNSGVDYLVTHTKKECILFIKMAANTKAMGQ